MASNWKRVASGYDDGLEEMVYKYVEQNQTEKDVFLSVFLDIYQDEPIKYIRNMVKLGYDGIELPTSKGGKHIVIYNPSKINLIK